MLGRNLMRMDLALSLTKAYAEIFILRLLLLSLRMLPQGNSDCRRATCKRPCIRRISAKE